MADPITDERLREIVDGTYCGFDEGIAIAAELLAARARIAKLEQEPPMAMIDFGVGVNWKAINEERQSVCAALQGIATALATAVGAEECPPVTAGNLHAIVDECLARIARLAHRRYQQTERIVDAGSLPSHLSIAEDFETVLDDVRRENEQLRADLREVAASGVEAETRQYVTVQIDPETWRKLQEVARG